MSRSVFRARPRLGLAERESDGGPRRHERPRRIAVPGAVYDLSRTPRPREVRPVPRAEQQIRFATARDGTRLAYATHGAGPPLVRAPTWLTHLEYDWDSPIWQPCLAAFGERYAMLRYDERGCGLSVWVVENFSLEAWVEDLETVVLAAGFERFALFGTSQGSQVATSYS